MDQYPYTASMEHNHHTVVRLNQVCHNVVHRGQRVFFAVAGVGLIFTGVFGSLGTSISTVLVAIGCWCVLMINYSARARTREMERALGGRYPRINYRFGEDGIDMQIQSERQPLEYRYIARWVTDRKYIYFLLVDNSIFMVDCSTLRPGDPDAFRGFIQQRCQAKWSYLGNIDYARILRRLKKTGRGEAK